MRMLRGKYTSATYMWVIWGFLWFLGACAAPQVLPGEEGAREAPELVGSWEEGCLDPTALVLECDEEVGCAFFRCSDVVGTRTVVPARGVGGGLAGSAASPRNPRRFWGSDQGMFSRAEPVFVIPWRNHDRRSIAQFYEQYMRLPPGRYVRHHIFPQAFKAWFMRKKIDIHQFTLILSERIHLRLHSGGPRGGLWNEAWREFIAEHPDAPPEAIWRHALDLIRRFELSEGPFVPYRGPAPIPPQAM